MVTIWDSKLIATKQYFKGNYIAYKITFLISAMISFGSLDDVVFMLQVKRSDRGLISPLSFTTLLKIKNIINSSD